MLRVGMGKSKNMAKSGHKVTCRERLVLKPLGSARSKRDVRTFDAITKIHKNAQGIIHGGIARGTLKWLIQGPSS